MSHQINITRIKAVNSALGNLKNKVVFVGGATVSLYADRMAPETRPTDDIDVLVEISSRWDFAALEENLRKMGFQNDTSSKFLGRYLLPGLIIDVMPTHEEILGFSNKWYAQGFINSIEYKIDDQNQVKIFAAPYFIASKLEAFKNRGKSDGRTSSDFEDIIFVLENRRTIWDEMNNAQEKLKQYLLAEFTILYNNPYIEEWIYSHSSSHSSPSTYFIMESIEGFLKNYR
jgi:predicted nucleotidyltransferase